MRVTQAVCFVFLVGVCTAQDWGNLFSNFGCRSIQKQDCFTWGDHPECGTNGVTYRNRCDYSKAHCADNTIHIAYKSACNAVTTPAPGTGGGINTGPIISGPDAIFDFFCLELSHEACHTDTETLCGSDGVTYINTCEFEKQRCTHRDLTVVKFEKC